MSQDLSAKYSEYLNLRGDVASRLHQIGYPNISVSPKTKIDTFEGFLDLVGNTDTMTRAELTKLLKMCFRTYLKRTDIVQLLKNGERAFHDSEVQEALRIMPIDVEGGVLADDLIEFLYN